MLLLFTETGVKPGHAFCDWRCVCVCPGLLVEGREMVPPAGRRRTCHPSRIAVGYSVRSCGAGLGAKLVDEQLPQLGQQDGLLHRHTFLQLRGQLQHSGRRGGLGALVSRAAGRGRAHRIGAADHADGAGQSWPGGPSEVPAMHTLARLILAAMGCRRRQAGGPSPGVKQPSPPGSPRSAPPA